MSNKFKHILNQLAIVFQGSEKFWPRIHFGAMQLVLFFSNFRSF